MDLLLYWIALAFVKILQALPLRTVARIGRCAGALAYWLDARHRKVAINNLTMCFGGEKSAAEILQIARENFKRIGESCCCAIKTSAMTFEQLQEHVELVNGKRMYPDPITNHAPTRIAVSGHFGNFELYARLGEFFPGVQTATTYRALRQRRLNDLVLQMRRRSKCLFFERRTEAAALKAAMSRPGILLGLLVDQHSGPGGAWVPFFGKECWTFTAPAVFALRYDCKLFTGFCFRTGLAQWRLEAGEEIPTHENGEPRAIAAITIDINRSFEAAIRRDPANWFWVHKRWKPKYP
jgi:Kdo2-lipid IVA lauroyltransferase/acyltransferase